MLDHLLDSDRVWLGLAIGNSHLHWGKFRGATLIETWDTDHLQKSPFEMGWDWLDGRSPLPLVVASVVPPQTEYWRNYPDLNVLKLEDLPLGGLYPTLGIDRALAVLGAGEKLGFPILLIDAGTALTVTGADGDRNLIGGAILPGLGLQFSALANRTATLPNLSIPDSLPRRFAANTGGAIQSGIIYTIIAGIWEFIKAWSAEFPGTKIAITGGDRDRILTYFKSQYPQMGTAIIATPEAIFWGMSTAMIGESRVADK